MWMKTGECVRSINQTKLKNLDKAKLHLLLWDNIIFLGVSNKCQLVSCFLIVVAGNWKYVKYWVEFWDFYAILCLADSSNAVSVNVVVAVIARFSYLREHLWIELWLKSNSAMLNLKSIVG